MKLNKKILITVSSFCLVATLTPIVVACNTKKESLENNTGSWLENNTNWKNNNYFRDPYKIHDLFSQDLDKVIKFENIKSKLPKKMQNYKSFNDWSKHIAKLIKEDVLAVAGQTKSQNLRDKKATVLVLQNRVELTDNKESYNRFSIITPPNFPLIYSQPQDQVPGLGLYFPKPKNESAISLVDKIPSIGELALKNNPNQTVSDLVSSFKQSADYVIYMYDSNLFTNEKYNNATYKNNPQYREKFFEELIKKDNFEANLFLKNKNSKIIFIDRTLLWWGSFAQIGQSEILDKLIEIFELEKINKKFIPFNNDELINIFESKPNLEERLKIINSSNMTSNQDNYNYGHKIVATWPDSVDHLLSFGLKPDAIVDYGSFKDVTVRTSSLSPYLRKYINFDQIEKTYKSPKDSEANEYINKDFAIYVSSAHLLNSTKKLIDVSKSGSWAIGTTQGTSEDTKTRINIRIADSNL